MSLNIYQIYAFTGAYLCAVLRPRLADDALGLDPVERVCERVKGHGLDVLAVGDGQRDVWRLLLVEEQTMHTVALANQQEALGRCNTERRDVSTQEAVTSAHREQ